MKIFLGILALVAAAVFLILSSAAVCGPTAIQARVGAEVNAMEAAVESYKADNGRYPSDPASSERLRPNVDFDPGLYVASSRLLYRALSGDSDGNPATTGTTDTKMYFEFRKQMLSGSGTAANTYIVDPWGNSYGYSNLKAQHPESKEGNNSTFDLWSTGGQRSDEGRIKWVKNW